jgi:hypothetical protein
MRRQRKRKPLPPQFFYGLIDWQIERTLDDAAKLASQEIFVQTPSIDKVFRRSTIRSLAEASVVAIYDFLEYPKEYKDPLNSVTVWKGDWDFGQNIGLGIDQGARRFVYHKLHFTAIAGKLHKNKMPGDSIEPK